MERVTYNTMLLQSQRALASGRDAGALGGTVDAGLAIIDNRDFVRVWISFGPSVLPTTTLALSTWRILHLATRMSIRIDGWV